MKPVTQQQYIEKALRRHTGMSPDKVEAMHSANETALWSARCWSCRETTTTIRSELKTCTHCGTNLWSRT